MLLRPLHHIKRNVVAYIALFVALTGTSYAAFTLPAGSVGSRQLQNRSVTSVKLDPTSIAASVRAWANLQWTGGVWRVQSSSRDIHVVSNTQGEQVSWRRTRFASNCMASVTPLRNFPGGVNVSPSGYVTTSFDPSAGFLSIFGIAVNGTPQVQSVNVLIVCPSRGSQKIK
jgi:hypothetical protein